LLQTNPKQNFEKKEVPLLAGMITGAILGFAAGLLNIGGGIFLSPVLILLGWASVKQAAAASALFIFCNSTAGLLSIKGQPLFVTDFSYLWFFAAILGGLLGAYFGSNLYQNKTIRYILASVMMVACSKLLFF
jgi:uncharacterized membrane protein YfcA